MIRNSLTSDFQTLLTYALNLIFSLRSNNAKEESNVVHYM
jgi:hypothetical protein